MKKSLDCVFQKINSNDYSLKEIALYFEKYDGYTLEIETELKTIRVKIYKKSLPHLLGLQHIYKNTFSKIFYKGEMGFKNILNEIITWDSIKEEIKQDKERKLSFKDIEKRITYLVMFLNTIEKKGYLKELDKSKTWRKTLLNGNYILYKEVYEINHLVYPMLSIKELNKDNYVIETFIVEDNNLLIGGLKSIKIKSIKLLKPQKEKKIIYN